MQNAQPVPFPYYMPPPSAPNTPVGFPNVAQHANPAPVTHLTVPTSAQKAKAITLREFILFSTVALGSVASFTYLLKDPTKLSEQFSKLSSLVNKLLDLQNDISKQTLPLENTESSQASTTSKATKVSPKTSASETSPPVKPSVPKTESEIKPSAIPPKKISKNTTADKTLPQKRGSFLSWKSVRKIGKIGGIAWVAHRFFMSANAEHNRNTLGEWMLSLGRRENFTPPAHEPGRGNPRDKQFWSDYDKLNSDMNPSWARED
jgi:hypothetical protein